MRRSFLFICVAVLLFPASECVNAQTQEPNDTGSTTTANSGDVFRVGGGVSPPRLIYSPDPEYSDQARKERFQGTCRLWLVVSADGIPRDIRVTRTLGFGLDEKAIEAVRQWTFEPALKDGRPVAVRINVEVNFRLHDDRSQRIKKLEKEANIGDAEAELELSEAYFQGKGVKKDEHAGYQLLLRAANRGLPQAQFQMGEYTASHGNRSGDYIDAYMWYVLAQRNRYKHSDESMKELAFKMSPEEISEAQKRAKIWPNLRGSDSTSSR